MKGYTAGLIDKSLHAINAKLQKKLVAECRKSLHTTNKAMFSQELNEFMFCLAKNREQLTRRL